MKRREFVVGSTAALALAGTSPLVSAQGAFQEGKHFVRLSTPVSVSAPAGKIEVVEFFWYGCPHCNAFEPALEAWIKKLPADVAFRRVHVGFRPNFEPQQRFYATLEALGLVEQIHRKVFYAIHHQGAKLDKPEALIEFAVQNGADRAKFTEMYNSFGMQNKVRQGKLLSEAYKIDGVPALGIHGRYYTSPSLAGGDNTPETEGQVRALALTDQLIARSRKGA
ncbi:thiol:disulfide interchange protein DsbA/DsbL [Sphaerotilus sp.]|jgi:thiol:disulfide interchange protein DsbA|uniref:thiol:disulfide interchange protein DsbA/DsbL n=1 Tax=Sphaerotilus sp. TaxID=2093942 RepID=UPI002ACD6F88|nr:thiol:disulfide interchange protein DsbA/DsbL [Sphaerotilus sp.]MDZ7856753.1 thiol:disulfide interchange protein DsbA/DsbL [Sphaerotilus sp.]